MSNHLTCAKLSPQFRSFVAKIDSTGISKNIQTAMNDPKWRMAMMEEIAALVGIKTWEMVPLPQSKKLIGCKWVFTIKHKADGSIEQYKARLVTQGFTQTYSIDYEKKFAPIAKLNSIRVLLSLTVNFDWPHLPI